MWPFDQNKQQMYQQYADAWDQGTYGQLPEQEVQQHHQQFVQNAPQPVVEQVHQQYYEHISNGISCVSPIRTIRIRFIPIWSKAARLMPRCDLGR